MVDQGQVVQRRVRLGNFFEISPRRSTNAALQSRKGIGGYDGLDLVVWDRGR
ncbi:MAG: hypothetical protein KatS3mg110_4292 [Pirellulaceae bacterium]|nr:MAG: hypothetical protein KatS3mg110_4292 [Pirellulaceae bacterium]